MNLSEDLAVEHMKSIRNEVAQRRYDGNSEPVKLTVVEAEWFVLWNEQRLARENGNRKILGMTEIDEGPAVRPYVGMEGTVFGFPCVVVAERESSETDA